MHRARAHAERGARWRRGVRCVAAGTTPWRATGGPGACVRGGRAPLLVRPRRVGCRGAGTHSNERKGAARVDCDVMGLVELCEGANVVVVEASITIAGEGGGRSGGAFAQFPRATTPTTVEVGLRDEREARNSVLRGSCTIYSDVRHVWHMRVSLDQKRRGRFIGRRRPMMNVDGVCGLLGQLVAELLTVLGAALNREETHQHWHPPRCVSDSLFRLTAPDGKHNWDKTS